MKKKKSVSVGKSVTKQTTQRKKVLKATEDKADALVEDEVAEKGNAG